VASSSIPNFSTPEHVPRHRSGAWFTAARQTVLKLMEQMPRRSSCAHRSLSRTSPRYGQRLHFTLRPASQYMHPVVALLTAGVEMDVLRNRLHELHAIRPERKWFRRTRVHPSSRRYPAGLLRRHQHKPETTFENVKADVLADKDPNFQRANFCSVIRNSSGRLIQRKRVFQRQVGPHLS